MMVIMCNDERRMDNFEYGYDVLKSKCWGFFILKWMEIELECWNNRIIDNLFGYVEFVETCIRKLIFGFNVEE